MNRSNLIKLGVFCLIVVGVGWALLEIDPTQVTPARVRAYVLSYGLWAPVMYFLIYGQPIVPLPASIMMATAGLAFGPLLGFLMAVATATVRACGQLFIARVLGQDVVAKLLRGKAAMLHQKIGEHAFKAVLLVRLIPNVPYDMQNYALGFSGVRFMPYALGTLIGVIPHAFTYTYLGYSLTDPQQLWKFIVAMLLIVGLVAGQRQYAKRHKASA